MDSARLPLRKRDIDMRCVQDAKARKTNRMRDGAPPPAESEFVDGIRDL
jgi:hypothetical protein